MWAFALGVYARLPQRDPLALEPAGRGGRVDGEAVGAVHAARHRHPHAGPCSWLLPRIDPRRANVERFAEDRRLIINLLIIFFAAVQAATFAHALGWPVQVDRVILASIGLLFVGLGNYLPRIRSNWFMGIRTPWTMDNERVWRATHRVGGRTFVAAGLVMALAALLPEPLRVLDGRRRHCRRRRGAAGLLVRGVPARPGRPADLTSEDWRDG